MFATLDLKFAYLDGFHVSGLVSAIIWPGLSENCLPEMESAMADPTITRQVLQVEHVKIETSKKFADVEAALERSVPQLDPAIGEALATGDEQRATELERKRWLNFRV
jgi:hypothetical protein